MKNFQEFADSLDQEFIDSIISETSYIMNQKASFPNTLLGNSFAISMRILERYHYWLHDE